MRLGEVFGGHDVQYAITHEAAAQRYAPFISHLAQVRARVLIGANADAAIAELGARVVSEGANLVVIEAQSPGELPLRERIDGLGLASSIQIYLDLLTGEGRFRDLAAHFRKERIGFCEHAGDARWLQRSLHGGTRAWHQHSLPAWGSLRDGLSSTLEFAQDFRVTDCNAQQGLCCAGGLAASLLPVLQRPCRHTEQPGELLLRQPDSGASLCSRRDFDLGYPRSLTVAHLLDGLQEVVLERGEIRGHLQLLCEAPR